MMCLVRPKKINQTHRERREREERGERDKHGIVHCLMCPCLLLVGKSMVPNYKAFPSQKTGVSRPSSHRVCLVIVGVLPLIPLILLMDEPCVKKHLSSRSWCTLEMLTS